MAADFGAQFYSNYFEQLKTFLQPREYYITLIFIFCLIIQLLFPYVDISRRPFKWKLQRWMFASLVSWMHLLWMYLARIIGYSLAIHANLVPLGIGNFFDARPEFEIFRWAATILMADLVFFAHHLVFHYTRWGRRVHMAHHVDTHVDVMTYTRVHPIETILYNIIFIYFVALIRPTMLELWSVILITQASGMLVHSNVRLPIRLERILGAVITTSGHHRRHHETARRVKNFGNIFTFWDRLVGTYAPPTEKDEFAFGVRGFGPETNNVMKFISLKFDRARISNE